MRGLLIITIVVFTFSANLFAQSDFITLDKLTYDYYLKGDYKNLKLIGDKMLLQGIDYYYLRMRLGILAFNNRKYPAAVKHFTRAVELNSFDTVSRGYVYNSYLFSGRKDDANLYLDSIDQRNSSLKPTRRSGFSRIYLSSAICGYNVIVEKPSNVDLNYEAIENSLAVNAGLEICFSSRFKGIFTYTNFRKSGREYARSTPLGADLNFSQNQIYINLTRLSFPGWAFSGFGHIAFYSIGGSKPQQGNRTQPATVRAEYLGGIGIAKNGWRIRAGGDFSLSNFSKSGQIRGEGFLTYLPFGNLNLYLTSGGMCQSDKNWGTTYQINQEIGLKVLKFLWFESGIVKGNSFLYSRNQGVEMNNSFLIPATNIYSNLIFMFGKHFSITASAYFSKNEIYSWDFNTYLRTDKKLLDSFCGNIKLTYNIK